MYLLLQEISVASAIGAFGVAAAIGTFDVSAACRFVVFAVTGASASVSAHVSLILAFDSTPMDKLPPAASAALRTLGTTGAAAFVAACASFVLKISTTPMNGLPPAGNASFRTEDGGVSVSEDLKRPHQHTKIQRKFLCQNS